MLDDPAHMRAFLEKEWRRLGGRRAFYRRKRREMRVAKRAMWKAIAAAAFLPRDVRRAIEDAHDAVEKAYKATSVEAMMSRPVGE